MKNIMLSIRPEWLQKILSGQKTVELRLSRPNLTPPFMVFLYCSCKGTKKPGEILEIHSGGKIYKANGLVVGEFTCTEIDRVVRVGYMGSNAPLQYCVNAQPGNYTPAGKLYEDACLTVKQAEDYEIAVRNGWMQLDEVRYDEGRNPLGLKFIRLGLDTVIYDPESKMIYTPNTKEWAKVEQKGGGDPIAD